ncbi:hypothetical protein ALT_5929, partial [Aspergillus lentulus]
NKVGCRLAPAGPTERVTKPHTLEDRTRCRRCLSGPSPGEGTGPNTQAVLEGSNDARTGMPPGIPGGAILHTFRTAFMLGSSAGAGPGARGLPGGRRNGGPAEATRFTYGNLCYDFYFL